MSEFKVIGVIDGITIKTQPNWAWRNRDDVELVGDVVKIAGYEVTPENNEEAKKRLISLLQDKYVALFNPIETGDTTYVLCEVHLNGVDISNYFPEFKKAAS